MFQLVDEWVKLWKHIGCAVAVCTHQRSCSEDSHMAVERTSEDCRWARPRYTSQSQQEKGSSLPVSHVTWILHYRLPAWWVYLSGSLPLLIYLVYFCMFVFCFVANKLSLYCMYTVSCWFSVLRIALVTVRSICCCVKASFSGRKLVNSCAIERLNVLLLCLQYCSQLTNLEIRVVYSQYCC